jgi:serine/threonine protein kinase
MYQVLHKIVQGTFDPPSKLRPEIPPEFERTILKAMARDPADRFSSVMALGAAILPLAGQRARIIWEPTFADAGRVSSAPAPPATAPEPWRRRARWSSRSPSPAPSGPTPSAR